MKKIAVIILILALTATASAESDRLSKQIPQLADTLVLTHTEMAFILENRAYGLEQACLVLEKAIADFKADGENEHAKTVEAMVDVATAGVLILKKNASLIRKNPGSPEGRELFRHMMRSDYFAVDIMERYPPRPVN